MSLGTMFLSPGRWIAMPEISLMMPVYNRPAYAREAIESVLSQSFEDFELLIWDDGSTDETPEVAEAYARRDGRVRVVRADHVGQTPSLLEAIRHTTGPYLGWVDSDDRLLPRALECTRGALRDRPEGGFVYTLFDTIDSHGARTGRGLACQIPYSPERILADFMTQQFRLIRREIYEQVGGIDPGQIRAQDYDLCLRMSEVAPVLHLDQVHYEYREHPGNVSRTDQLEQIFCSKEAVERALIRRGLADRFELELTLVARVRLRPKPPEAGPGRAATLRR
jgi:glycosyltransferase involved in cell wall biosynthesis